MVPDPDFVESPDVYIGGTSNEFSWSQEIDLEEEDSYIALTWSHVPETELSIASEREFINSNKDLIMFTQSFEWPYERIPYDVNGFLEYSILTTGNFSNNEDADEMFEVYWWLIDSSDNRALIYYSEPPHSEIASNFSINLNYFDIAEGWRGMVEDDNGLQEDPTDILTIAFGLAPTDSFRSNNLTQPWMTYSGNVTARFYSAYLATIITTESDLSELLQPTYNNSYGPPASEIFSQYDQIEAYGIQNHLESMDIGPDNSVYTIGRTVYYEPPQSYGSQVLVKWNSDTSVNWVRRYGNKTNGRSVCVDGSTIYTGGVIYQENTGPDLLLAKYDTWGNILWDTTYDSGREDYNPQIVVTPTGSIVVCFNSYEYESRTAYSGIIEFGSNGSLLREDLISEPVLLDVKVDSDGNIYVLSRTNLLKFDSNLVLQWDSSSWNLDETITAIDLDSNGSLYTSSFSIINETRDFLATIRKWDSSGTSSWNTTITTDYGFGFRNRVECHSLAVAPDFSLFATIEQIRFGERLALIKLDSNGRMEWNHSILSDSFPCACCIPRTWIDVGLNGMIYISYSDFITNQGLKYALGAYQYTTIFPNQSAYQMHVFTMISLAITIGSIGVILFVVVLTIHHKKRIPPVSFC
jgi:hypothetical protein